MKQIFKRVFAFVTILSLILSLAPFCYGLEANGYEYELTSKPNEVRITKYIGTSSSIVIPDVLAGRTVAEIGNSAFSGNNTVKSVIISSSVSRIMTRAFANCASLESVSIPASVTSIGDSAFSGCVSLNNLQISSPSTSIGYYAFMGCTALTSVTIPSRVIKDEAFRNCTSLDVINLTGSVQSVGRYAFDGTAWYINNSDSLKILNNVLYRYNGNDTIVKVPDSVKCIADFAFYDSNAETVVLHDDIYYVGKNAFFNCNNMKSISLPISVISIDSKAFGYNNNGKVPDFIIYCYENSYPHSWANGNGFTAHFVDNCSHNYSDWIVVKQPDCINKGLQEAHCVKCNDYITEDIAPLGHKWSGWITDTELTCTIDGVEKRTCTTCRVIEDKITPAIGHAWGEWTVLTNPNCVNPGERSHICSTCNVEEKQVIDPLGHVWIVNDETDSDGWITLFEPDCENPGKMTRTCSVCNFEDVLESEPKGHTSDEWTVIKDPTSIKEGVKKGTCTVCNKEFTAPIPVITEELPDDVQSLTLIEGSKLSFDDTRTCVLGVEQNTTVRDFLSEFNYPSHILVTDVQLNELSLDDLIGTGKFICLVRYNEETEQNEPVDGMFVVIKGDIDGNGKVSVVDARLALRVSIKLENLSKPYFAAADIDGNGKVTAFEARTIIRVANRLESFE